MAFTVAAQGQTAPLVIAFAAPLCGSTAGCSGNSQFNSFVLNILPSVSGIGATVHWADMDDCTLGGVMGNPSTPCQQPLTDNDAQCPINGGSNGYKYYYWCQLDQELLNYIGINSFANKKIILLIWGVSDFSTTGGSPVTPPYVFTQSWANTAGISLGCLSSCVPQEMVVCGAWKGDVSNTSCPVQYSGSSFPSASAIWNVNGNGYVTGTLGCAPNISGSGLSCPTPSSSPNPCTGSEIDNTGFPIVYENPYNTAYQNFLKDLVFHYNPVTGSAHGQTIAPHIAYVRVGMAEGAENQPFCAVSSNIKQQPWSPSLVVPAGFIVNSSNNEYVAIGAGTTGPTSMPTCSPAGCTTAADGSVPGWYRADAYTPPSPTANNSIWPGPKGQFGGESQQYWDDGYLASWPTGDGLGHIAAMTSFLKSLGASFPFDINQHPGPPSNNTVAYADSEAIIAAGNNVGFGIEAANVYDARSFPTGIFPASLNDWAHNFDTYSAPVHHLQTANPGSMNSAGNGPFFAAGFAISSISDPAGVATLTCYADCSVYANLPIYITGNTNPLLNGVYQACPSTTSLTCTPSTLTFQTSVSGMGNNGIVWAADYWPIIMPFDLQHNATSIEVYECDLDYAFGLYQLGGGSNLYTTTTWVTSESGFSGCLAESYVVAGSDKSYINGLSNVLAGQPSTTSIRAGTSTLFNGYQF
jgi:hypothetical protein